MMKKQRLIAGFLILTMILSLTGMLATPASATAPTVTVAPEIKYATDSGAFLKDIELSQTGAWNLTVRANPKASGQTYAVLLRYDLFAANYNTDGSIGGINPGTYTSLAPGTANSNYYRYENATAANGTVLTIFNKSLYNFNSGATGYQVGETSTTYHMKYALVIFDGGTDVRDLSDYTIVTFYINSEGRLQTESYMLRYQTNKYPTGTNTVGSMPAYQIEGWGTAAGVNGTTRPTRVGYTFLGWDANSKLMNADANTASRQDVTPQYPAGNAGPVPWDTISAAFGTNTFNKDSDKFYDLYAQWKPNKVEFDLTDAQPVASVNGVDIHVLTLPEPQVGVAYSQTITLGLPAKGYTTDSGTGKGYSWPTEYIGKAITVAGDDPGTTVNLTTAHQLSVVTSGNTQWRISGTPTAHSNGKPVYAVLQVKDNGNNTTDLIVLRFQEVKKGAQPVPTLDDNTGLQSRIVTGKGEDETETKDGQIYGFYSAGPTKSEETGYLTDTDGTGTMTNYYIKNRMIYEYQPRVVNGEDVTSYENLPNDGWREVPMPSNWYGENHITGAVREAYLNSLKKNAQAVITTGYDPNDGSHAPVTVITDLPEDFTGWPDSYGWIEYDGMLPIIHGLNENDVYAIRFRSNPAYEVSEEQRITIGGAVASSGGETGGSGGLAINLSGGDEPKDAAKDVYDRFVADAAALKPNDTLKIPEFTPTRENYSFAGWTLGERDENGQLILYRAAGSENPPAAENVTVKWIDGTNDSEISHTVTSVPKGTTVPESDYPEAPDHTAEGYTFVDWTVSVDETTGDITIRANYTTTTPPVPEARDGEGEEPTPGETVTVTWVDGQVEAGQDGYQLKQEQVTLTADGELPDPLEHPDVPEHEGYTFEKWEAAKNEDGSYTVTAVYRQNETPTPPAQTVRDTVTMPSTGPASLAAVWNSTTNGILAVSVSDWDGVSLGTFIFRTDANPSTQAENAQAALDEFLAREDVAAVLKSHAGYDFLTLVKDEDGVPTSYGKRVDSNTNTSVVDLELSPEDAVDFSTLKNSTSAKVAYTTNDTIQLGEGLSAAEARDARYYKTSIDSYGRFGIGQSFAIRIKVERGNVPRVTEGYLRVRMVIGGADIYSQYALSGADEEIIEVVPFAQASTSGLTGASIVEWTVIDAYNESNWVGAGTRTTLSECQSRASFTVRDVGTSRNQLVWDSGTYPFEGVVAGINDTLASYHALKLEDPSISPSNSNMAGISLPILRTIGIPPRAIATTRSALYDKYVENGAQPLDYASMYEAASGQPLQ